MAKKSASLFLMNAAASVRDDRVNRPKKAVLATPQGPRRRIFLPEAEVLVPEHCVVACHRLVCQGSRRCATQKIVATVIKHTRVSQDLS